MLDSGVLMVRSDVTLQSDCGESPRGCTLLDSLCVSSTPTISARLGLRFIAFPSLPSIARINPFRCFFRLSLTLALDTALDVFVGDSSQVIRGRCLGELGH